MKVSNALVLFSSCLLYDIAQASPVPETRSDQHGVVTMPLAKRFNGGLSRREAISTNISNGLLVGEPHYYVQVEVGTPPQVLNLVVDTGSSDTWLFGPQFCNLPGANCFHPNTSSTYKSLSSSAPKLVTSYTGGTQANGTFFKDNLVLANAEVKGLQMGEITSGNKDGFSGVGHGGIMGLGFTFGEADAHSGYIYATIVDTMYDENLITTRAFSLYLDDKDAATGNLIFGGYDTAKYNGELTTFNIDLYGLDQPRLAVPLTSISISDPDKCNSSKVIWSVDLDAGEKPLATVLDSGDPQANIPTVAAWKAIFNSLQNDYGLNLTSFNQSSSDGIIAPCDGLAKIEAGLDLVFTDSATRAQTTINVPFKEAVTASHGNQCLIALIPPPADLPPSLNFITMGDPVMRSMYLLFNYDTTSISMAQASLNMEASNVVPL